MATENSLQTQCQACGKTITFLKGRLGESWPCPHCGEETLLKPKRRKTAPKKRTEPADPPCTLYVPCPKCGGSVVFDEDEDTYQCSKCPFAIPAVVAERRITPDEAEQLLAEGTVGPLGPFAGEDGEVCSATLSLDDNLILQFEPESAPDDDDSTNAASQGSEPPRRDCRALMQTANRHLFRQNAFRITGLPIEASPRQMAKHVDRLKLMEELGHGATAHTAAFALNPPPSGDDIRSAIQRLKDPELRLIDELFWFWPKQFGRTQSDPALEALTNGDADTAKNIWKTDAASTTDGITASHNLAVLYHMAALDRANEILESQVVLSKAISESIGDWRSAMNRWEQFLLEDRAWDNLASRIRQLDDPRLGPDLARLIRSALPEALDKINATLALEYAQRRITDLARIHASLLWEPSQVPRQVENTIDSVLAPIKDLLREHVRQAQQASTDAPESADDAAKTLHRDSTPLLDILDLFYPKGNPSRDDLFDEVAAACTSCAVAYQRKSDDNDTFVTILTQALNLAVSSDLQERIRNNIRIGKSNLAHESLEPFLDALRAIENSSDSLHHKFTRIRDEVITPLKRRQNSDPNEKEALDRLSCQIAVALRSISIDLHNQNDDTEHALVVINLAHDLARDSGLQSRIAEDIRQLSKIKERNEAHNLRLQIRDDQVEVDAKKVRYNSTVLPEHDVTGVRFGVFRQYLNGVNTSTSYIIGLTSSAHGSIQIECKRFFRSEDQAKQDFSAILDSLFYHVIPSLVSRIAKSIAAGNPYSLGDCVLTREGIQASVGVLLWKEDVLIPWSDIRFGTAEGQLNLRSSQNRKFSKSYSLRDVWNAVIFEYIVKTLMEKRA